MDVIELKPHPARYTDALFIPMAYLLQGRAKILDPMPGVGGVFKLLHWLPRAEITAIELEPEWALADPRIQQGNAMHLPFTDRTFDAICCSPPYGNRMADKHLPDGTRRITYANYLGRDLSEDNAAALQWGPRYRTLMKAIWQEATRVLKDDGVFILNIKDHIRDGNIQPVSEWHIETLCSLGYTVSKHYKVIIPSHRYGQNYDARVEYESVVRLDRTFIHKELAK